MARRSIDGIVLLVQEARFQLRDFDGVSHQFELSCKARIGTGTTRTAHA